MKMNDMYMTETLKTLIFYRHRIVIKSRRHNYYNNSMHLIASISRRRIRESHTPAVCSDPKSDLNAS